MSSAPRCFVFEINVSAQLNVLMTKHKFLPLREQSVIVSSDSAPNDDGWDWKERLWLVSDLIKATCESNFRCKSWPWGFLRDFPLPQWESFKFNLENPRNPSRAQTGSWFHKSAVWLKGLRPALLC